jgi:hypothetical protein
MESRKERILYKMSSEIANMMKMDTEAGMEGADFVYSYLKVFASDHPGSISHIPLLLNEFYTIMSKKGIKQKQRRGIGYKINKILRDNEKALETLGEEFKWETIENENNNVQ